MEGIFDCDGVLIDFVDGVLEKVRRRTGLLISTDQLPEWDIFPQIEKIWDGLDHPAKKEYPTGKRLGAALEFDVCAPGFCRSLKPIHGAVEGLQKIREMGVNVHIVTSPYNSNPTWHGERERSLAEHFGIHHHDVTHSSAKYRFLGDFIVDDKPEHCDKWGERHGYDGVMFWDTPHNRRDVTPQTPHGRRRVIGWPQLADSIECLRLVQRVKNPMLPVMHARR